MFKEIFQRRKATKEAPTQTPEPHAPTPHPIPIFDFRHHFMDDREKLKIQLELLRNHKR